MNAPRALGIGGALLLVATAALHLSGYGEVAGQLQNAGLPDFWREALKATWVFFGVQLVIIAAAVAAQFTQRNAANRAVLFVCTALLVGNVVVLIAWLGFFIGAVAIAAATISIGTATALLVRGA